MMGNYMNYKEDSEHLEFMPNTPASDTNISFAENKEQSEKESLSNKMDTEPLYVQKENQVRHKYIKSFKIHQFTEYKVPRIVAYVKKDKPLNKLKPKTKYEIDFNLKLESWTTVQSMGQKKQKHPPKYLFGIRQPTEFEINLKDILFKLENNISVKRNI